MRTRVLLLCIFALGMQSCTFFQPKGDPIVSGVTKEWLYVDSALREAAAIPYAPDGDDYWQMPRETLLRGKGDCEDKAIYLLYLLNEGGIYDVQITLGSCRGRGHAWLVWQGKYILDPTRKPVGIREISAEADYVYKGVAYFGFAKP